MVDLNAMSKDDLLKLKSDVEKAIVNAEKRALQEARAAAEKAVAEFGLSLDDITGGNKTKTTAAKKPGQARYRNPEDPTQTWTGKGRQPLWFKTALSKGIDPETLEI